MTILNQNGRSACVLVALATATGFCLTAHAQWGSVHANNRDRGEREHEEHRGPAVENNRPREVHVEPAHREPVRIEQEHRHYDVDVDRHRGYFW